MTTGEITVDAYGVEWRQVVKFRVVTIPKGQPRPRAFARKMGDKFVARVYDAGTAEAFKGDIAAAARAHLPAAPLFGPIRMDAMILFPRPARMLKKKSLQGRLFHISRPDVDNIFKALADCLTQIGMWADDCQVCAGEVRKMYCAVGEQPGCEIEICVLNI